MDSFNSERDLIKLKANVIKAILKGERGPWAKKKVRYIRCVFRDLKEDGCVTDQTICKKVWKEETKDGRCPDEELRKKRIRIREIRLEINRKLHGEDLNTPFKLNLPFYIERYNDMKTGLTPIFDREKILEAIEEDRKKTGTKTKTLKEVDLNRNIIDIWNMYNREIFWKQGFEAFDIENGFSNDEIKIHFLDEPQDISQRAKRTKKLICNDWIQSKSNYEDDFSPFTSYGLFKVKTPILPRRLELVLKNTDYFNFLAVQEVLKKNKVEYNDIDARKPLPKISHSISPAALLVIEDDGKEIAIFAKRSKQNKIGTGRGLMGLPIDNTPIRPPTEEEKIKLEALNLEIPAHDDQNNLLFHNRLKKGAQLECNIEIGLEEIKILAFGLDTQRYLYNLIGIVRKKITYRELTSSKKSEQFNKLIPKPFYPNNIIKFIRELPEEECCPTTQAAALFALCQKFGLEEVTKQIKRNQKRT